MTAKKTKPATTAAAKKPASKPAAVISATAPKELKPKGKKPAVTGAVKEAPPIALNTAAGGGLIFASDLPIAALIPWPNNPRRVADQEKIDELAESIAQLGVLQPLIVRRQTEGVELFEVLAGERRRKALSMLIDDGRLPADFRAPVRIAMISDAEALLAAGAENMARDGMHPLDEAQLFEDLMTIHGLTIPDLRDRLGVSERTIYRRLRLMELTERVKTSFRVGHIGQNQAEAFCGADAARQDEIIAHIDDKTSVKEIRARLTAGYPSLAKAKFKASDYADRGGRFLTDAHEDRVCLDVALFVELQSAAIDQIEAELAAKFPWVDRLETDGSYYALHGSTHYTRNPAMKPYPGAGALILISPGKHLVDVVENVLRPGVFEKLEKASAEQIEMFSEQVAEAEASGDAMPEPPKPDEPDQEAGEAARLMTKAQIETVRIAQTRALRDGLAQNPKAGLAYACMIMLGAVDEIAFAYQSRYRAPEAAAQLSIALERLAAIWDSAPDPETIASPYDLSHWFRQAKGRAADCFSALAYHADETALAGLLAALTAIKAANWHDPNQDDQTPAASPLTAALAQVVKADLFMSQHWRPAAEYWSGYDKVALKATLHRAGQDLAAFKSMRKGELVAACASLDPADTLGLPELRFMTEFDSQDAVIEARAEIIRLEQAEKASATADAGAASEDAEAA